MQPANLGGLESTKTIQQLWQLLGQRHPQHDLLIKECSSAKLFRCPHTLYLIAVGTSLVKGSAQTIKLHIKHIISETCAIVKRLQDYLLSVGVYKEAHVVGRGPCCGTVHVDLRRPSVPANARTSDSVCKTGNQGC